MTGPYAVLTPAPFTSSGNDNRRQPEVSALAFPIVTRTAGPLTSGVHNLVAYCGLDMILLKSCVSGLRGGGTLRGGGLGGINDILMGLNSNCDNGLF